MREDARGADENDPKRPCNNNVNILTNQVLSLSCTPTPARVLGATLDSINAHSRDREIQFYEEGHKYTFNGIILRISVSAFKGLFIPPFEREPILEKMFSGGKTEIKGGDLRIKRNEQARSPGTQKNIGSSREDIIAKWNQTSVDGSYVHKCIENWFNSRADHAGFQKLNRTQRLDEVMGFVDAHLRSKFKRAMDQFIELYGSLYREGWRIYRTEWSVCNEDDLLAGSIDAVFVRVNDTTNEREFAIVDWKLSDRYFKGEKDWKKKDSGMYYPIQHVDDTLMNEYSLQVHIYGHILRSKYMLNVVAYFIIQLRPSTQHGIRHVAADMRKEVASILDCWHKYIEFEEATVETYDGRRMPLNSPWHPSTVYPVYRNN